MKIALFSIALAVLAGAAAPASSAETCFRMSQVTGHTVADDHTLYLGTGRDQIWRLTLSGNCLAAKSSSDPLVTETRGGSDRVCKPLDLDLKIAGPGGVSACIISKIEPLTPAEVAAVPRKLRP